MFPRARRALVLTAALASVLGASLLIGWQGVVLDFSALRLSARAPRNPLLLAAACLLGAWALAPAGRRGASLAAECRWLVTRAASAVGAPFRAIAANARVVGPALTGVAIALVIAVGFVEGDLVAAGSDSSGYVSQAHLWATGKLRVPPPLLAELISIAPGPALAPLGYLYSRENAALVPTYPPGLPIQMAVLLLSVGRQAVFWAMPLLGGLTVAATYLLGRRVAGPLGGALAAALVAASPALLFQLTGPPMSDLAAAAWWTLALALCCSQRPFATFGAGLAAGIAVLTRPNLVPLAAVLAAYLLWLAVREWRDGSAPARQQDGWRAWAIPGWGGGPWLPPLGAARRLLLFLPGAVGGCLAVAAVNTHLFGSPLGSGYDIKGLFGMENALPNLLRYPPLIAEMHTPLIALALIAPFALRRRDHPGSGSLDERALLWTALVFALVAFACYLLYPGFDSYWRLRFLLPAIPVLLVLATSALSALIGRFPPAVGAFITLALGTLLVWHGVTYSRDRAAFDTDGEFKYELIGDHVARRLPARAVLFAMQHSGSLRYYSERPIVRYDQLPKRRLDRAVSRLRRLGYRPYFVLDGWEEPLFRERFAPHSELGNLDWPPVAILSFGDVRIYDPADRARSFAGERVETEILPWPFPLPGQ